MSCNSDNEFEVTTDATETDLGDPDGGNDSGANEDGGTAEECILENCFDEIAACMGDPECDGWMTCIQSCGDDAMVCPTFCGMYYSSPLSGEFTECAVEAECLEIDFSGFPVCDVPILPQLDLEGMEGTWWFAASSDEPHLFDYDCQKFEFIEQSPTFLDVDFSVPLSDNGEEKICGTPGTFQQHGDGTVEVVYENYAAYHENWYLLHKSENTLLAHLCFASEGDARDYGTLVLSRVPLHSLSSAEYGPLNDAVTAHLSVELHQLLQVAIEGCANE